MDILDLLPKTLQRNQYVLAITNHYSKQSRAFPKSKTTASRVANLFYDDWIILFRITTHLLSANGS